MSLENAITEIKKLAEAENIFKPASQEELGKRKEQVNSGVNELLKPYGFKVGDRIETIGWKEVGIHCGSGRFGMRGGGLNMLGVITGAEPVSAWLGGSVGGSIGVQVRIDHVGTYVCRPKYIRRLVTDENEV